MEGYRKPNGNRVDLRSSATSIRNGRDATAAADSIHGWPSAPFPRWTVRVCPSGASRSDPHRGAIRTHRVPTLVAGTSCGLLVGESREGVDGEGVEADAHQGGVEGVREAGQLEDRHGGGEDRGGLALAVADHQVEPCMNHQDRRRALGGQDSPEEPAPGGDRAMA